MSERRECEKPCFSHAGLLGVHFLRALSQQFPQVFWPQK
ncbi:mCG1042835 [Mus musculus]|nr:mCG1042835 [Mus musculus]